MLPIRELLNKIRWDPRWAGSVFEIGYLDRVANRMIRIPFRSIRLEAENSFAFELEDPEGDWVSVPLHRIREVHRDGSLIWRRPG